MSDALSQQVGGSHYKGMAVQPIDFAMNSSYDAATFSVLKYLSRHEFKNGVEDVRKAAHFVRLRDQIAASPRRVTIDEYISKNGITGMTADALGRNHAIFEMTEMDPVATRALLGRLNALAIENYGEPL